MNTINITEFKKKIFKSRHLCYRIAPYCSLELATVCHHGAIIIKTDLVQELTVVNSNRKPKFYLIPIDKNLKEFICENKDFIKKITKVDAPYVGVYNIKNEVIYKEVRL